MSDYEPRLYLIMREDLFDNSPGKMMAQAAHAQADFDDVARDCVNHKPLWDWREDRSFGTTIVLSGTLEQIKNVVDSSDSAGLTIDPTYPYRNYYGKVFTTNEVTCAWVFAATQEEADLVAHLPLHQ